MIGFSFTSDWLRKWGEIVNRSRRAAKNKNEKKKCEINFDTRLKTALQQLLSLLVHSYDYLSSTNLDMVQKP